MADSPDFHEYLRKQLIQYVKEEQKKGFSLQEIEEVLIDVGHHKNLIQECFDEIKKEEAGQAVEPPSDELKQDLVNDVKRSIENFFGQMKSDKDVKETKKQATVGEEIDIIEEAVEEVRAEERTFIFEGIVFFIYLVALVVLVLFTAASTGDDFVLVAIGLSASFINTFVSFAAMSFAGNVPIYIFIPIVVASGFYALGTFGGVAVFKHMDMESLGIVNAVISMFFNILIINVAFLKPKEKKVEQALVKKQGEIEEVKEEEAKAEKEVHAHPRKHEHETPHGHAPHPHPHHAATSGGHHEAAHQGHEPEVPRPKKHHDIERLREM